MKSIVAILITAFLSFIIFRHFNFDTKRQSTSLSVNDPVKPITKPLLNIVYNQDVSGSNKQNGVELISSSVFTPYYATTDRDININFGCISNVSAQKLISLELNAITFSVPTIPDLSIASITEKQKLKQSYLDNLKRYRADSLQYFSDRNKRISDFNERIDALIEIYRHKLTSETDLITSVAIADKVFNYPGSNSVQNVLILNSDGIDSHKRTITKMRNKATVILVNAGGNNHTSIDSILTITLQSSEQAIQFSLNINHNKN